MEDNDDILNDNEEEKGSDEEDGEDIMENMEEYVMHVIDKYFLGIMHTGQS
jgi:hypothetical protein